MDVELYVYDLSKGLARQMSQQFLGTQIDAVYHTAIVFGGREYFFGSGVQITWPGSTHHGRPMEIIKMGRTELPLDVILEFLESLKQVYTTENYDLFLHNCNNFTNDFAMFLVGKEIPKHITSLPQTVLETPFGQMLRPQIDQAMRGITQAPAAPSAIPPSAARRPSNGATASSSSMSNGSATAGQPTGMVHNVTQLRILDQYLDSAKNSAAVIFFTSATCPPCKIVYPAYDELAVEAGDKAVLIKVDVSQAHEIASRYQVRATPTFMSFLRGEKESEWVGANESQLRGNVRLLLQMAHPLHPHSQMRLPTLQRNQLKHLTTYAKIPPLDKLVAKLGSCSKDPAVVSLKDFISARNTSFAANAPLPPLPSIGAFIQMAVNTMPNDALFPVIDLFKLALVDPRVSGYFAEEASHATVLAVFTKVESAADDCPYTLRIVTVQMACNLFTSPLFSSQLLSKPSLATPLVHLVASSLLDSSHTQIRVAASALAFNIAARNHVQRLDDKDDLLHTDSQVELMALLIEAVGREKESKESVKALLLAMGLLAYSAPQDGELLEACQLLEAKDVVEGKKGFDKDIESVRKEVAMVVG